MVRTGRTAFRAAAASSPQTVPGWHKRSSAHRAPPDIAAAASAAVDSPSRLDLRPHPIAQASLCTGEILQLLELRRHRLVGEDRRVLKNLGLDVLDGVGIRVARADQVGELRGVLALEH